MKRPVLSLQTIYFDESDRPDACRLGSDLYERLTRGIKEPLGPGPGIPILVGVQADRLDLQVAETVVVIPVLGKETYSQMADDVLHTLMVWHRSLGPGHVLVIPASENWRSREGELPGKQMLTMLYGKGDPRCRTLDEIVLATTRIWEPAKGNVQLFVSHAKADLATTDEAARKIHEFVVTDTTGRAFFDANELRPGESLDEQLDKAVSHGVLVAVRGDAYSSRVWCQRELLLAKLNGLPTLTVEILRRGELRSSPYGGNTPSLVWDGNPSRVVSQAMVEWLRSEHFKREAARIKEAAHLPEDVRVLARPPELLDLAQGPLETDRAQLVLHPEPELSVIERRVLKAARPRLHLATPSTAFRRLLGRRDETADVASPLEGMQVAMSLSESPDADGPDGFTQHHVVDATVHVARTVISSGAAISYGGDFRAGGYTYLLAQLIQTYNQTATKRAKDLQIYLAAILSLKDAPSDVALSVHYLKKGPIAAEALLPDPSSPDAPPAALYFSDMRRVMEKHVDARVILGGNSNPRTEVGGQGYGGRYPGVAEEAWRALEARKPLYVAGGFGGAAAIVADLLDGKETPKKLQDATWLSFPVYAQNAAKLDGHPLRSTLGLPRTMEDLAAAIADLARSHLLDDGSSKDWNGLSREENRLLFRTRDPVTLAALVSRGLLAVARKKGEDLLQIELVHDSLTAADKLDVIAIATLDGVPLGGAGAAIDQVTGGSATDARSMGRTLVSLKDSLIDADWLFLASLGRLGGPQPIIEGVLQAARDTSEQSIRHGFQRVGIVTFGGNVLSETKDIAAAMLRGFTQLSGRSVLVWYETDDRRFEALCELLAADPQVKLTTRRALTEISPVAAVEEPFVLNVRLANDRLAVTCLPPSSSAIVSASSTEISAAALAELAEGQGVSKRATPSQETLDQRGRNLAGQLFGPQAAAILSACRASKLVVVHDAPASKVPFEMLLADPDLRPALEGGITRRLSAEGLAFERQFAKPPKRGKLKVLLIANPTKDLPGAAEEAKSVKAALATQSKYVDLGVLWEEQATVANVTAALARSDILHYCGHAFFDGPEPRQSGLILARRTEFTGEDLRKIEPLPRMAFVNACEAGRVRGRGVANAAAFAELFLRSGIEAYLGTFWEVGDAAAAIFAGTVYAQLALGKPLDLAVLAGRKALFPKYPDWANYMLFGGASFRLVTEV